MLSRAQAGRVKALHRRTGREESGEFLVEGIRQVEDLVASQVVPRLALISPSLEDTDRGRDLAARVRAITTTIDVSEAELGRLATTETTQGIVVVATIPRTTLMDVPLRERALVIVLDAVQDPGNFGTIVRSADAFGAALIVVLPGTVDPWNPKAVRSAAGSSLRIPIVETTLDTVLEHLRANGALLLGADMAGESVEGVRHDGPVALALGNEGAGLSDAVRAACDRLVSVPIGGSAESLNVGVAAGILMYLLSRTS
ncbi:MAG TPA: RNA methyltransferase [Longimicrobiales bacterium]|nr:RNA methyltransferase [Longimicrobiales bacterium]